VKTTTRLSPQMRSPPIAAGSAPRVLAIALVVVSLLVLLGCALLAYVHIDDRYRTDHVTGTRIALARYAAEDTLYPPLHEDGRYGGTRFMPLPIVLHAAVGKVTGEYLVSGRLLSYAVTLAVLLVLVILLRRLRCAVPVILGLLAVVIGTPAGLSAVMGLRADSLALLLQLLGVALVAESSRPRWTVAAAVLASLAFLAKLTAVWAPAAICLWLLLVDRRRLAWFLPTYAATVGILLALFGVLTDGRLFENVFGLSTAGVEGLGSLLHGPYRLLLVLLDEAIPLWLLLPIAGAALWFAGRHRRWTAYQLGLVFALVVLIVEMADVGTGSNQIVDLAALTVLVIGAFASHRWADSAHGAVASAGLMVALLWGNIAGIAGAVAPDIRDVVGDRSVFRAEPLRESVRPHSRVLSEDPYVPISMGQPPVVLDPFMLLRIDRQDPAAVDDLLRRIRAHDFDLVVLVEPLAPVDAEWWREFHFGPRVVAAIADSYVLDRIADGYYLYVPAATSGRPVTPKEAR
jgi:hypothetical protein